MDKERRRSRHRVDAIESDLERLRHIFVCLFAEADMTIADLEKAKIRSRRQRASCFRDFSKGSRCKHPAAYGPKQPRASPCHALEKAAAVNPVVFVVVRNVIGHNFLFGFGSWVVSTCLYRIDTILFPESLGGCATGHPSPFLSGIALRWLSLRKRRAQALAHSAASYKARTTLNRRLPAPPGRQRAPEN